MTTLLIDGSNLSIIHFTANPAADSNGVPIGMVKGFLGALAWMNITLKPSRIIIFFDGKNNSTQRKQIFSEYKEGRKGKLVVGRHYKFSTEEAANKNRDYQFFVLRDLLEDLPVSVLICNGFETDDAISYCVKHRKFFNLDPIHIVSCDKDFYQLIDDNISIYNPMSKKVLSKKDVVEEYGIHPRNWLLYRSIAGDASDNLDGVYGIGPKTLLKLFDLGSEIEFDVEDLELLCDSILEEGVEKNKSVIKNLQKIKSNISVIKRNWSLMSLSEPMVSSLSKDVLDGAVQEKELRYRKLDFWKKAAKYSVGLNLSVFDDFKHLTRINK